MFEKIRKILLDYVDCNPEDITPETRLVMELGMNSFDLFIMIARLEEEFGITIEEEELLEIVTVGDLASYIDKKQN